MIDVKDEILAGEPRSRIKDANGNVIYDNVSIEMITPVAQEGTPLNKEFFESIKSGNDLVQKYNVLKFESSDENSVYCSLDNIIANYETAMRVLIDNEEMWDHVTTSPIPIFASSDGTNKADYTKDGFKISGPKYSNNDYQLSYLVCDKNDATYYIGTGGVFKITFPYPMKIKKIKIKGQSTYSITVSGILLDGTTVALKTLTATNLTEFEVESNELFSGIQCTVPNGKWLYTLDVSEALIPKAKNNETVYLNINGLGNKMIIGEIYNGEKRELLYDGTAFNVVE